MAETEVIVTKFEADLTDLDKGVSEYETSLNGASKAASDLDKKTSELGGSVGKLAPKFDAVKQSSDRTVRSIASVREEIKKIEASKVKLIDPAAVAAANQRIAALKKELSGLEKAGTSAGTKSKELFGSITQGASQAAPGLSNITSLFGGMGGPIGIAAAAVAGFIANFTRIDSVKTFFDAVKLGFDNIGDRLANLDFRSFFDPKTQAQDAAFAVQVANQLDAIADAQLRINKANAEAELKITGLNQQLRDRTKTDEERLAIAAEITSIEEKRARDEQALLQVQLVNQRAINNQQLKALGEVSDANKAALNERQVALLQAQQRTVQLTETTERRVNSILEQGASEREAIAEKSAAARAKIEAEAARNEQARAQATAKLDSITAGLASAQLAAQQTAAEKEVQAVRDKYAAIEKATAEGIAKLREVSGPQEQATITQREADIAIQIETAKNAELDALEKARLESQAKTQAEAEDQLRKTLLTQTELEREAALQRLDADLALAEKTLGLGEQYDAFRIERIKKAEAEVNAVLTESQAAQLETEKASLEERVRLQEEAQVAIGTAVGESVALLIGAAAKGEDVQTQARLS